MNIEGQGDYKADYYKYTLIATLCHLNSPCLYWNWMQVGREGKCKCKNYIQL